jgi:hypothetical protein
VHGAAYQEGVESVEVDIGTGGTADHAAAGGTQDVGDPFGDTSCGARG